MVEVMIIAGLAGYIGWPWWVAAALGAASGVWRFSAQVADAAWILDPAWSRHRSLIVGALILVAFSSGFFSGFLVKWIMSDW